MRTSFRVAITESVIRGLRSIRNVIVFVVTGSARLLRRPFVWGITVGIALVLLVRGANTVTSTDSFCESCHTHPQATSSWIQSTHYVTKSGTVIHCVECHLPPGGVAYGLQKTRLGIRDAYGAVFKDVESIDWDERSQLEHATSYTFRESCLDCHPNLFPVELTDKGEEAHLHYEQYSDSLRCLNCHLHVGHYDPDADKEIDFGLVEVVDAEVYDAPAIVEGFVDYTEFIPGTTVSFEMVAVPGGTFEMGSPLSEPYRGADEGPTHQVAVSSFWMGRVEVTWDEFEAWYRATRAEGRTDTRLAGVAEAAGVDAITGATPPYVPPDQGWGKGDRPAITMTHHAAHEYTRCLSMVTGKRYRLPTEAEWEYAARAGTQTPYFFEGSPKRLTQRRFWNRLFGPNTATLDSFVVHAGNSGGRTQPPSDVAPNPFGLVNMLGNVREFCLDWYEPETYSERAAGTAMVDPRGPDAGKEHVVRGGSFRSDPADLRVAARDRTRSAACRMTDPQAPKSIWWYSDCTDIGFRVVREMTQEGELR
jgi:formylglycine-generating enzyme required for sulfatase activity